MTEPATPSRWVNPTAALTVERIGASDWLATIDARIDELCDHWDLTPTRRLDGGALSVVVAATDTAGTAKVIKIPIPRTGVLEADVLATWNTHDHHGAAVTLLDRHGVAMLLELIDGPGTPTATLSGNLDDEAASLEPILSTIRATPAATLSSATPTSVWIDIQTAKAHGRFTDSGHDHLVDDLYDRAEALNELCMRTRGDERLCHGDLWHHNVLRRPDNTWCMIDPAGMTAPIEADIGLWSVCAEWGLRVPERIEALCQTVDADPAVAATWAAWQCLDRAGVAIAYQFDVDRRIPQLLAAHDELIADTNLF